MNRWWIWTTIFGAMFGFAVWGSCSRAHADSLFEMCPSGRDGIATGVTSCPFADNVRRAWFTQPGNEVVAYSPVTGQEYVMGCVTGYLAHFTGGQAVTAVKCFGGNDAEVVIW